MKRMSPFLVYFLAVRGPFLSASAIPVLVGTAMAHGQGYSLNPLFFWLNLAGVVALHFGANAANDYYDYLSGADPARPVKPFSGGSQLLQRGILRPRHYFYLIFGHLALAVLIAFFFGYTRGPLALVLGLAGALVAYYYTAPPVKLSYRGLGEVAVGLTFGPLAILGSFLVQGGEPGLLPILAGLPPGFLIANVLYVNQYADYLEDREAGKRNLVVILGRERALPGVYLLFVAAYLSLIAAVGAGALPPRALAACLTAPLARRAADELHRRLKETERLSGASAATIAVHGLTGLLLALACLQDGPGS